MQCVASHMVLSGGCQHPPLLKLCLQGFPALRDLMARGLPRHFQRVGCGETALLEGSPRAAFSLSGGF